MPTVRRTLLLKQQAASAFTYENRIMLESFVSHVRLDLFLAEGFALWEVVWRC